MKQSLPSVELSEAILFLGSGFSADARNIRGEPLLTGDSLVEYLGNFVDGGAADHDLQTIADELREQPNVNLYQILYELFTVKSLTDVQTSILERPWRRIYTTNYDDAVEHGLTKLKKRADSYSYDEPKPRKLHAGAVIHLHGVIRRATADNVLDQLVLNEASYIRQHFERSPWYDEFVRDVRFCSACYFIGYRLRDQHIAALLLQNPAFRDKTFFIAREPVDPIFKRRVEKFGHVVPIGLSGFDKHCREVIASPSVTSQHRSKAFQFVDPQKDKKPIAPPTTLEVLNLVTFGAFNAQRCFDSLPGATYVVPRQIEVNEAVASLQGARCLLVHSRIGNGKTIFLHLLSYRLSEMGYRCYWYRAGAPITNADLDFLRSQKRLALVFDSYNAAIECADQINEWPEEAKFIVEVRTGVQDVRLHEIRERLPTPLARIGLNRLREVDAENFVQLLDASGVGTSDLEGAVRRSRDVREVVVSLYGNQQIRDRIADALLPVLQDARFRKVFVAGQLLSAVGIESETSFLRAVTGYDPYLELSRFRELASDLFSLDDADVRVRSAMFSEYVIEHHVSADDVIDTVFSIVIEAVKRKSERRYQAVLGTLMRYSQLARILRRHSHANELLVALFERWRRDFEVNKEPLFWLQFSILYTALGQLDLAERLIGTAYERAHDIPGFQTFQIDTYALKLFLDAERGQCLGGAVSRFDQIVEKMERVRAMIADESRRSHAIEVLNGVEQFVSARFSDLSPPQQVSLVYHLNLVSRSLAALVVDAQVRTGSELARASIERAIARLASFSEKA